MHMTMQLRRFLLPLLAGAALVATAAPLKTDLARSSVSAAFTQMDVPVDAKFTRFTAQIDCVSIQA